MNVKKAGKKIVAAVMIMTMSVLGLSGCKSSDEKTESGYSKNINILIWSSGHNEENFAKFEEEYGIHVNVSYINNTDEILAKLLNGDSEYDLIDLESAYVETFVKNGLLEKINDDNVTNQKNIYEDLFGVVGDEDDTYTVPISGGGYTEIIYNVETCPIEIKKFLDLANPALKGQICMVNSTISLFGVALEALGYSAQSNNEKEISEAADLLASIKPNVKAFVGSSGVSQMVEGECSVGLLWDLGGIMADEANWGKFEVAKIDTGYERFGSTMAIPKGAKHKEEAELFLNFLLRPEIHASEVSLWGGIPAMDCEEYLPEGYLDNPAFAMYDTFKDDTWMAPVNDEQIEIMDKYLTKFMSE